MEASHQVLTVSQLLGMDHIGTDLSLADAPGAFAQELPYEEAVTFLKGRVPVTKKEWKDLEPKLRFRAFTIAKLAQYEAIEKVRQGLLAALDKGQGLAAFWSDLEAKESASPYYWETVYRTNIQTSYNAGRKIQIDKTKPDFLQLIVIEDERTTKKICLPLVGLTLPYNDPFWKTHWPPFHFNCRTTVRPIYGKAVSTPLQIPFKPQSGFGRDPLDSGNYWMMLPEMFHRGLITGAITEFNFMDNVLADYGQLWKGYKRTEGKNGGFVDTTTTPAEDLAKNKPIAQELADAGYKVKILPEFPNVTGWKNPDALVDSSLFDFKEPEMMTKRGVEGRLDSAHKQHVRNVVLRIPDKMDTNELKRGIAGYFGTSPNNIDRIIVLLRGSVFDLNQEKIRLREFGF